MSTVKTTGDSFSFPSSGDGIISSRWRFRAEGSYFAKSESSQFYSWTQLNHSFHGAQACNKVNWQEEEEDNRKPDLPPVRLSKISHLHIKQVSYRFNGENPISLRAQKIESCRKEMMEMIKGLPEIGFELSLKDLVEHSVKVTAEQEGNNGDFLRGTETAEKQKKRKSATGKMSSCLRILFPVSQSAVASFEQQNQLSLIDDGQKSREDELPKKNQRVAHGGRSFSGCYSFFSRRKQAEQCR